MYCNNCGTECNEFDSYCNNCGARINSTSGNKVGINSTRINNTRINGFHEVNLKINFVGIIASIILIISVCIPFAKVSILGFNMSKNLVENGGDGDIFIGLAIVTIVLCLINKSKLIIAAGIINLILTIIEIIGFSDWNPEYKDFIEPGIGFYLLIVATALLLFAIPIQRFIEKFMNGRG